MENGLGIAEPGHDPVEAAVHGADLEMGIRARGDGGQRAAQGETPHRDASAGPRDGRPRYRARRLRLVPGTVAYGEREGVVTLRCRSGATWARAHLAIPDGAAVGTAAKAPDDVRLAVVGAKHANLGRLVRRPSVAELDARRLARQPGGDHRRLGRQQRHLRRLAVHGDLLRGVDHPALVAPHDAHPVDPVGHRIPVVVTPVPAEPVLRVARQPALVHDTADLAALRVHDHERDAGRLREVEAHLGRVAVVVPVR